MSTQIFHNEIKLNQDKNSTQNSIQNKTLDKFHEKSQDQLRREYLQLLDYNHNQWYLNQDIKDEAEKSKRVKEYSAEQDILPIIGGLFEIPKNCRHQCRLSEKEAKLLNEYLAICSPDSPFKKFVEIVLQKFPVGEPDLIFQMSCLIAMLEEDIYHIMNRLSFLEDISRADHYSDLKDYPIWLYRIYEKEVRWIEDAFKLRPINNPEADNAELDSEALRVIDDLDNVDDFIYNRQRNENNRWKRYIKNLAREISSKNETLDMYLKVLPQITRIRDELAHKYTLPALSARDKDQMMSLKVLHLRGRRGLNQYCNILGALLTNEPQLNLMKQCSLKLPDSSRSKEEYLKFLSDLDYFCNDLSSFIERCEKDWERDKIDLQTVRWMINYEWRPMSLMFHNEKLLGTDESRKEYYKVVQDRIAFYKNGLEKAKPALPLVRSIRTSLREDINSIDVSTANEKILKELVPLYKPDTRAMKALQQILSNLKVVDAPSLGANIIFTIAKPLVMRSSRTCHSER